MIVGEKLRGEQLGFCFGSTGYSCVLEDGLGTDIGTAGALLDRAGSGGGALMAGGGNIATAWRLPSLGFGRRWIGVVVAVLVVVVLGGGLLARGGLGQQWEVQVEPEGQGGTSGKRVETDARQAPAVSRREIVQADVSTRSVAVTSSFTGTEVVILARSTIRDRRAPKRGSMTS